MSPFKLVLTFVVILIITGIGYAGWRRTFSSSTTVDPTSAGGEKLVGTDDIQPIGDQNFSISPDGKLLLYSSEQGNPFEPVYVLYDIEMRQRYEVGLSPEVYKLSAEGGGPLGHTGCWNADGTKVFLPGNYPNILFFADVSVEKPQWHLMQDVPKQEFRYYYECPSHVAGASLVRVVQRSDKEAEIVDARNPERILARHRVGGFTRDRIVVHYLTVSPDTKWIAYVVSEYAGSFVSPSRGYVLDISSGSALNPRLLAAPVFGPIRWSADSRVVYASAREFRGDTNIYRWKVGNEN